MTVVGETLIRGGARVHDSLVASTYYWIRADTLRATRVLIVLTVKVCLTLSGTLIEVLALVFYTAASATLEAKVTEVVLNLVAMQANRRVSATPV